MVSGLHYLIAARRYEVDELEQLACTSELVNAIAQLVHALQGERGASNLVLSASDSRYAELRAARVECAVAAQDQAQAALERLRTGGRRFGNGARLFNRIAGALAHLAALPALRAQVDAHTLRPNAATQAFGALIDSLLAVVFEAADGATDPQVARCLVAMFNFMQGKEYSGQERACGSAAFSSGTLPVEGRDRWVHCIESQERCFQIFRDFAEEADRAAWQAVLEGADTAELERLRRIGFTAPKGRLDSQLAPAWFALCSRRIDAMHAIEQLLMARLHALCAQGIAQALEEVARHEALLQPTDAPGAALPDPTPPQPVAHAGPRLGRQLERAVLDLVQEQSQRLQSLSDELAAARTALHERKAVERAKGLLMAHRQLSEPDAYKLLRQTAMDQKRRLVDVAESLLAVADILPRA